MRRALKLYWMVLFVPLALAWLGAGLNQLVVYANGDLMPVLYNDCNNAVLTADHVHTCLTSATHLKPLCDIILTNDGVSSIGDVLQTTGPSTILPCTLLWFGIMGFSLIREGRNDLP